MKIVFITLSILFSLSVQADTPNSLEQLIQQVQLEANSEQQHHQAREQRFIQERDKQKQRLDEVKQQLKEAQHLSEQMRQEYQDNQQQLLKLDQELAQQAGDLTSLFAIAKQNAGEIESLIGTSLISAEIPQRKENLQQIINNQNQTLSMQELKQLWMLLLEEMHQSGKVREFDAPVISPNGEEVESSITRIGVFTASQQGQFLRYLSDTGKLVQLARQPAISYQNRAKDFEQIESGTQLAIVDPSKGELLNLLLQTPDIKERIQQGGVIAYIILVFGVLGLLIVVYRYLYMLSTSWRVKKQLKDHSAQANNPMGRLMLLFEKMPGLKAENMSIRLDEAVNSEAQRLHFGLKTLTIIAAITPLLGLLGTVTGMIETFQSISLFGSGDPKLMSGGISQALVTTQLGLAVAIPILLLHALLQGKANRLLELLDAQSALLFENYVNPALSSAEKQYD